MSQEDLSRRLNVSFQQVQKYEKGANRISAARLLDVADILNIDVLFFLTDVKSYGGNGKTVAEASRITNFMATKDGIDISKAMAQLGPVHRRELVGLARALVSAYAT